MNHLVAEIDRIVRQVLADLNAAGDGAAVGSRQAASERERGVSVPQRVVTLATLEGRLDGAAVVTVPRGAVVTPAVRDELKARKIRLEFADGENPCSGNSAAVEVVVGVADVAGDPGAVLSAIRGQLAGMAAVRSIPGGGNDKLKCVVRQVGQAAAHGAALGVVVTSRPAAAAGLANRLRGVRAVCGCGVKTVTDAVRTFAPNVLAYNPGDYAVSEQRAMLRGFVRGGVRECPAEFRDENVEIDPHELARG